MLKRGHAISFGLPTDCFKNPLPRGFLNWIPSLDPAPGLKRRRSGLCRFDPDLWRPIMTRSPATPQPSASSQRIGADQRRAGRTLYRKTFLIHPLIEGVIGPAIATRAHDFSSVGVGLIHSGRMHKGSQFVVPLAT